MLILTRRVIYLFSLRVLMILRRGLWASVLYLWLLGTSCATRQEVALKYEDLTENAPSAQGLTPNFTSNRTVVLFLIDGLPVSTLKNELAKRKLPNLDRYFLNGQRTFNLARTVFPSLTYPSIGALLTESPVDHSQIWGNTVSENGKQIDYESFTNYPKLNELLKGKDIFPRLKAKGLRTVSLDFAFHADSSVHLVTKDIQSGLSLLDKDYSYVDQKIASSLKLLLQDSPPSRWPDFVFVHLVGLDFTSHDDGPESQEAAQYLEFLDHAMGPVLNILTHVEKSHQRQIVTMLTADHGFDKKVWRVVEIEKIIKKFDSKISIINESRFAALSFPPTLSEEKRAALLTDLESRPDMDIVARTTAGHILIQGKGLSTSVTYSFQSGCPESDFKIAIQTFGQTPGQTTPFMCPEALDQSSNDLFDPYFIANLSHYFAAKFHPDAVLIPLPGVAFTNKYEGQHGGPTAAETFVPLLLRNGRLDTTSGPPPLSTILRFM